MGNYKLQIQTQHAVISVTVIQQFHMKIMKNKSVTQKDLIYHITLVFQKYIGGI